MDKDKKETHVEIIGFQEEIAKIQTAIADFESGHKLNIAIMAEPFAGRTTLLNEIEKMNQYKVTRLSFSSIVKNIDDVKLSEQSKRIVMIDDCQFLYGRVKERSFNLPLLIKLHGLISSMQLSFGISLCKKWFHPVML